MNIKKKIYLVGGAVRDKLMGIPINDKDYVAIGYEADEFSHLQRVGKDFPVFLLSCGSELALARIEKKTASGYNGFTTQTHNVTLEEDLLRRDLTINSIAFDEESKSYIDPYNGTKDIQNKILRHTSNAFTEDPLRVLRIARFRAKFGKEWSISDSTKELISTMKNELQYLQKDRVYKEIKKASTYKEFHLLFETLYELDVLDSIFPIISVLIKDQTSFKLAMRLMQTLHSQSLELKLCAIYYYIFQIQNGNKVLELDIKLPKKMDHYIIALITKIDRFNIIENEENINIVALFTSFRRNKKLLEDLLYFNKAVVCIEKDSKLTTAKKLNNDIITNIFNEISSYSPKTWIDSLSTKPSNLKISGHIQNYNLRVISRYKQLHTKLFIP